jgi:hypothetical protein
VFDVLTHAGRGACAGSAATADRAERATAARRCCRLLPALVLGPRRRGPAAPNAPVSMSRVCAVRRAHQPRVEAVLLRGLGGGVRAGGVSTWVARGLPMPRRSMPRRLRRNSRRFRSSARGEADGRRSFLDRPSEGRSASGPVFGSSLPGPIHGRDCTAPLGSLVRVRPCKLRRRRLSSNRRAGGDAGRLSPFGRSQRSSPTGT